MSTRWQPLGVRRGTRSDASFEALHEGVPPWIRNKLREWVEVWLAKDPECLALAQAMLRVEEVDWSGNTGLAYHGLEQRMLADDEFFLDVIDFRLQTFADYSAQQELEFRLGVGGSAWTINEHDSRVALERRVDEAVASAAQQVIAESGRAGNHLSKAWREAYGRDPQPTVAYDESIKAVEAAAIPTISPRNARATLGTLLRNLRDAPQNFSVTLSGLGGTEDVVTVAKMMDLLWKGHPARHGNPDRSRPTDVSQPEAEAAVHLAVTLVHWFDKGFVRRS